MLFLLFFIYIYLCIKPRTGVAKAAKAVFPFVGDEENEILVSFFSIAEVYFLLYIRVINKIVII